MAGTRPSLRASDADRERVAERLRQAATEGRLLAEELEDRLATAFRARTYGELDSVVEDLPDPTADYSRRPARRRRSAAQSLLRQQPAVGVLALATFTLLLCVLAAVVLAGMFAFSGVWVLVVLMVFARRGGATRHGHDFRRYRRF